MWTGLRGKFGKRRTWKKRTSRYTSDWLSCSLGSIVNLSGSGIRLRIEGRPTLSVGQVLAVTLSSPQSRLSLRARVRWVKRPGLRARTHEVGFEFIDVTPALSDAIKNLALFGFVPRTHVPPPAGAAGGGTSLGGGRGTLPDHYAVLGLSPGATTQDIYHAYRELARQLHPDRNPSADAAVRFDAVTKAYRVLRDADSREAYDLLRANNA